MKAKLPLLTLIVALALTACSGSDKGKQAAASLTAAWGNPEAVQQVASQYVASRDSLSMPGDASSMDKAFVDACAGNDSIHMLARAIAMTPSDLGKEIAGTIIDLLKDDKGIEPANAQLALADLAYSMLGRNADVAQCYAAVDEAAKALPEDKQMQVYVNSCSPETLGDAMREERASDATATDRRAKIVEGILTGDKLEAFKSHYYNK